MNVRLIALDRDGNPMRLDLPVLSSGGPAYVPRVGESIMLLDRTVVVHSVTYAPLGDEADPRPFLTIVGRATS